MAENKQNTTVITADIDMDDFYKERIKDLTERLEFAEETCCRLREALMRKGKLADEMEANSDARIAELEAENAKLRGKILKLVESYV